MGTNGIIILVCALLLFAYLFDLSSKKTRIPSVILLLLTGFGVKSILGIFQIESPDFSTLLPIFGTVGLILIVLEGAIELQIDKSRLPLIRTSLLAATVQLLAISGTLALALSTYMEIPFRQALLSSIPVAIISSAIAIPSARHLNPEHREYITYESSISDILGVLFFNFVHQNETVAWSSVGTFGIQLVAMLLVTLAATLFLAFLIKRIKHHVKFAPIIILLILIYAAAKSLHLPALLFVLIFGLFLANLEQFKHRRIFRALNPGSFNKEIEKFAELTGEATFLIRAVFFLIFGFLIAPEEVTNLNSLLFAALSVLIMIAYRAVTLSLLKQPLHPLLFLAPRGLITVLLFLSIEPELQTDIINKSFITQVILITALFLIPGNMAAKQVKT